MSIHTLAGAGAPAISRAPETKRMPTIVGNPAWPGENGSEIANFRPAPTATAAVADQLRRLILQGRLQPGQLLHQQHLATRLGVSRMPVSHAFARLEAEGLVTIMPYRFACARVATVSADECGELFDMRLALEGCALRHALPLHTPGTLNDVRTLERALEIDEGPDHWIAAGQQFYAALYAPGARSLTARKALWFQQFLERYYLAFPCSADVDHTAWTHRYRALVEAVEQGDEAGAQRRLAENLEAMKMVIQGLLPCSAGPGHQAALKAA